MIRAASTGPTPGRASSCASVAVFRLTGPVGGTPPPASAGGGVPPTTTSSPSVSLRARLTYDRSVPGSTPPAASIASATRDPAGSVTRPGCRTRPLTATTITPEVAETGTAAACVTAGTGSTCGRLHQASVAATRTTTAATSANARTPRRRGSIVANRDPTGGRDTAGGDAA